MPDGFPIFIGITGKRELSDDPATAAEREGEVRRRLSAVFDYIDRQSGDTRKILLTGAAAGADLMAAEEALRPGRNWLVLAALPFEPELFRQDFTADQWAAYTRVTRDHRSRVWVLPALKTPAGEPGQAADIARRPDAAPDQKDLRRRYYEHVGLWIADTANILIAVLPSEERADRVGGSARIVACRRGGPDPIAAEVIAASEVLMPRAELHRTPKGHAWLIDPATEPLCGDPPVTVLPPAPENVPSVVLYQAPVAVDATNDPESQPEHLQDSQQLLTVAREYLRDNTVRTSSADVQRSELASWPITEDTAQLLAGISNTLRNPTSRSAEIYRLTVYTQIGMVLLSVLAFEIFAKFLSENPFPLLVYVLLLGLIMVSRTRAERMQLQPIAEDRRAIREVLRVQIAWWYAGLADRADHMYLQGTDFPGAGHEFAQVREAVRNVIVYALLTCGMKTPRPNWKNVFDPDRWPGFDPLISAARFPRDWVGNQLFYFRQRMEQRRINAEIGETMNENLYGTAAWLAVLLLVSPPSMGFRLPGFVGATPALAHWVKQCAAIVLVAGTAGWWWIGGQIQSRFRARRTTPGTLPLAILIGLPAAVLLFLAARLIATIVEGGNQPFTWATIVVVLILVTCYLAYWRRKILPDLNGVHPAASAFSLGAVILFGFMLQAAAAVSGGHSYEHTAKYMTIVLIVFLPPLGGALRFVSEKFAIEAEALSYRDAHVWFEHARELLGTLNPGRGDTHADERAREIIRRLGALALGENEAWLKSRHQRRQAPITGG